MIVLVKIGHMRMLLPSERGVQTLITVLAKAQVVEDDQRYMGGGIKVKNKPVDVTIELLPGFAITRKREVLDPEVIRPERKQIDGPRTNLISDRMARQIMAGTRQLRAGGAV